MKNILIPFISFSLLLFSACGPDYTAPEEELPPDPSPGIIEEPPTESLTISATEAPSLDDDLACIEIFQPVCGMLEVICVAEPCELVPQTFSNKCFAEKAGVTEILEGECETLEETIEEPELSP